MAINAHKMAPSTGQWLPIRVWDTTTKGLLWHSDSAESLPVALQYLDWFRKVRPLASRWFDQTERDTSSASVHPPSLDEGVPTSRGRARTILLLTIENRWPTLSIYSFQNEFGFKRQLLVFSLKSILSVNLGIEFGPFPVRNE